MSNKFKKFSVIIAAPILALSAYVITGSAYAQSMAESMCQSHMPIVRQAIDLRKNGVPRDTAKNMADSSFDLNKDLWRFLRSAIDFAYKNPQGAEAALNDGRLLKACAKKLMGG